MQAELITYDFGIGWSDFKADTYEGTVSRMSDYHMHPYYEISLIISGDVKVFLPNSTDHGTHSRVVLSAPATPHLIVCGQMPVYKRINLLFSSEFVYEHTKTRVNLRHIFGKHGRVVELDVKAQAELSAIAEELICDEDMYRRRLRLLIFLSKLQELIKDERGTEEPPKYIHGAISYIEENFNQRIYSEKLAWQLGVGRTTLMTGFKRYTGATLNEYITGCRIREAVKLLQSGQKQSTAADACGFGDACNLIRCFKRVLGMTPAKYVRMLPAEPKII